MVWSAWWERDAERAATLIALLCRALVVAFEIVAATVAITVALGADLAHNALELGPEIAFYLTARYRLPRLERGLAWLIRATMLATAAWIAFEAVGALGEPAADAGVLALLAVMASFALNRCAAYVLAAAARRLRGRRAEHLRFEARHLRIDSYAGLTAGLGIGLTQLGIAAWFDPAAGLVIAGFLVWAVAGSFRDHGAAPEHRMR